jgi:hypothetical protein
MKEQTMKYGNKQGAGLNPTKPAINKSPCSVFLFFLKGKKERKE